LRKTEPSSERTRLKIALVLIALLAYPALIHLSLAFDRPLVIAGTWLVISAVGMTAAILRRSASMVLLFGALLTAGIGLWWLGQAVDLMYLPPVLINVALLVLFGRTLLPGATPIVARVAALWRGTLDETVARYTRRVTEAWTIFFAIMAVESIALALFAPLYVWSLFTNCLNYLLVLLFFIVEYQLRFYFLPDHEHLSFRAFCRLLITTDLHGLAR
jgi:uncharacterized membrane protein